MKGEQDFFYCHTTEICEKCFKRDSIGSEALLEIIKCRRNLTHKSSSLFDAHFMEKYSLELIYIRHKKDHRNDKRHRIAKSE